MQATTHPKRNIAHFKNVHKNTNTQTHMMFVDCIDSICEVNRFRCVYVCVSTQTHIQLKLCMVTMKPAQSCIIDVAQLIRSLTHSPNPFPSVTLVLLHTLSILSLRLYKSDFEAVAVLHACIDPSNRDEQGAKCQLHGTNKCFH